MMFFVYAFSMRLGDFEVVGAWSLKTEAEAHAQKLRNSGNASVGVVESDWHTQMEREFRNRLGPVAEALEKLKVLSPDPDPPCFVDVKETKGEATLYGDKSPFPLAAVRRSPT